MENLILMCIAHASVIDDPQSLQSYTSEVLHDWKNQQLAKHRYLSEGWPLTTKMAEEALLASEGPGISIRNSTVILGGEGGSAPGSGGGGGGAIGDYARGGRGGPGGRITNALGDPLISGGIDQLLSTDSDAAPGSGGRGGGAIGPWAVGGDGGGGGDVAALALPVQPGDILEVEIGEGGKSPFLPGQHSASGEDTVIRHRTAAGELIREYRVRGGEGAKSGELPDDWGVITAHDLEGGFQVSTLMTCDFFELNQGRLHLLGGAWENLLVPHLPCDVVWRIICIVGWERLERGLIRGLQICVTNPEGDEVSRIQVGLPDTALSGWSYIWPVLIGVALEREGHWGVHVQSGEYLLSRIVINVSAPTQGTHATSNS